MLSVHAINAMKMEEFVQRVGWVFENSPWVAQRAWENQPFSSVDQLYESMVKAVWEAEDDLQLALLCAHPDLGTRVKMTDVSKREQAGAGLDELTETEYEEFMALNRAYVEKFKFPFIMAVRGQSKETIRIALKERSGLDYQAERVKAMLEVCKIARFRLNDMIQLKGAVLMPAEAFPNKEPNRTLYYGKGDVWVYRTYAKPLEGVRIIPESGFTGRKNIILGMNIKVAVEGTAFFPSFIHGDNSLVVATDSMKNFILRQAGNYQGSTMEGFLEFVSRRFLETYPQMTGIRISGEQIPFDELPVPVEHHFVASPLVFRYSLNEQACAAFEIQRENDSLVVAGRSSGVTGLKLIKVKGSSFHGYVKDEYTTLPESFNRPLFIFLNIHWTYKDPMDANGENPPGYVAAEQVRDIAHTVFHEENSPSIQNLIYRIGLRILRRFPQLAEVRFESNNRTWETVLDEIPASGEGKVYTEPRPPYGFQGFSMTHVDLQEEAGEEG